MRFVIRIIFITTLALLASPTQLWARGLTTGEYFWDTDPGQGLGTTISAADGAFNSMVEGILQSGINLPAVGTHTFNVRVKDDNGNWGPAFKTVVDVQAAAATLRTIQVSSAEYFFDTDPGAGNGSAMLAFDGNFDGALEVVTKSGINLPAVGTHTFSMRVKDAVNVWGPAFSTVIDIQASSTSLRAINVAAAEYFFDTDPGAGNGSVMLALDGNFNSAVEDITKSGINLPAIGTHTFNIRAKDIGGTWGPVFSTVIDVMASSTSLRSINVATAEYFFDTDPGAGNGSVMLALDGNFNSAVEDITKSGINLPAIGTHTFNIRAKDIGGAWGPVFSTVIDVLASSTSLRAINVAAAEYFFDTDPGTGNGSLMLALDGNFNNAVEAITQSGINLPALAHTPSMYGPKILAALGVRCSAP